MEVKASSRNAQSVRKELATQRQKMSDLYKLVEKVREAIALATDKALEARNLALKIDGEKVGDVEFQHYERRVSKLDGMPEFTKVAVGDREKVFGKLKEG